MWEKYLLTGRFRQVRGRKRLGLDTQLPKTVDEALKVHKSRKVLQLRVITSTPHAWSKSK